MIDELSLFKSGFCEGFFLFRFLYMQEFLEGNQYLHTAILVIQIFFGSDETIMLSFGFLYSDTQSS